MLSGLNLVGNIDIDSIQALAASVYEASQVKYKPVGEPLGTFFDDVYPAYLEALTTKADYFLSDIELLALARCTQQNIAIFMHNVQEKNLTYIRSYVANSQLPIVMTSVQNHGGQGVIRTHFERLSLKDESLLYPGKKAAPKRAKTLEDLGFSNRNKEDQDESAALAPVSADTKEMSLARPTKLPAPKSAETCKDLGPSNENREGQRKMQFLQMYLQIGLLLRLATLSWACAWRVHMTRVSTEDRQTTNQTLAVKTQTAIANQRAKKTRR